MKLVLIVGVIVLIGGAWLVLGGNDTPSGDTPMAMEKKQGATPQPATAVDVTKPIPAGTYTINPEKSLVNWAAKKPLIDGYINSGTLKVTEGSVTVAPTATQGSFTIDMNTLDVGLTAKKPGQEGKLEEHLKGERFFNVAAFPTATFVITQVTPVANPTTQETHTLTGNLTMKGATHAVSFPAVVTATDGTLMAKATTEIDRTKWGITAGSKNFFENLGDNMIDDMIGLSITLEAKKQ